MTFGSESSGNPSQGRLRGKRSADRHRRAFEGARPRLRQRAIAAALLLSSLAAAGAARATPDAIAGIGLSQRETHTPACDLLRVWVIYIGQGDSILIQIPARFATPSLPAGELVDVLVDGGPSGKQLEVFLQALYPEPTTIEHVVLTHHDSDHVTGLTGLLKSPHFTVGHIYHNGLASWQLESHGFPLDAWPDRSEAIYDSRKTKGMGRLLADGITLRKEALVESLEELKGLDEESFQGTYARFAKAALAQEPEVRSFRRSHRKSGSDFVPGVVGDATCGPLSLEPLWPQERPRKFGGWGYTINGNSVTFKLTYGEFSMLFAGDHNEVSEEIMLDRLRRENDLASLKSDVLKTPHHGSKHNLKAFFEAVDPVVSIASMGKRGFSFNWKHPSTEVIAWSGGTKRNYHTYIHERPFSWPERADDPLPGGMVERKHVLVETDGTCFRVVEVEDIEDPDQEPPSVRETVEGDGTRWICEGA